MTQSLGSAGTLGKALAECFSVAGARLVLAYNRTRPPPEFEERCRHLGARGLTLVQCNVADIEGCRSLVRKVHMRPKMPTGKVITIMHANRT